MSWPPRNPQQQGFPPPQNPYGSGPYNSGYQPPLPIQVPQVVHIKESPKYLPHKTWGMKEIILSIVAEVLILLLILPVVENAINQGNMTVAIYGALIGQFGGMYAVWIGFMLYSTFKKGQKSFIRDFGFKVKWYDIFIGLGIGFITLTLQSIINGIVYYSQYNTLTNFTPTLPLITTDPVLPVWYTILFGLVLPVLCAPFFEELYFRGFIMGGMIKFFKRFTDIPQLAWMNKLKYVFSTTLSSILFGMIHIQDYHTQSDWMTPLLVGSTGLILAWTAVIFKRLGPGMFGHATHNSIITFNSL